MPDKERIGERLPDVFAQAAEQHGRHFARYLYAAPRASAKRVLDAACGKGLGSAFLARVAASVVGLDIDEQKLAWAREHFRAEDLRFETHDLHEPISGGPFDLIVSFETLEHVRDPRRCLGNLAAALADNGLAMISTPNGTLERLKGAKDYEYHPNKFSMEDFRGLMESGFAKVELFSQVYSKTLGHYLRGLLGSRRHRAGDYRFAPGLQGSAKTWLAVCRKS